MLKRRKKGYIISFAFSANTIDVDVVAVLIDFADFFVAFIPSSLPSILDSLPV